MSYRDPPPAYAVLEADQMFFPLRKESGFESSMIHLYPIDEDYIPPAIGPFTSPQRKGVEGYSSRDDAVRVCCERSEQDVLIKQWERIAASHEICPERNDWYRDEIARMTGKAPYTLQLDTFACAITHATTERKRYSISGEGWTVSEALEVLYERVYKVMTTAKEIHEMDIALLCPCRRT
jgi:hypothetical protein